MVDCPEYEKQELTKDQIFWSNFFKDSINQDGELSFELCCDGVLKKGSELTFLGKNINDLINPDYEFFEIVKKIIMDYEKMRGGPSLAALSSHYQNCLCVLAAIYACSNHQELEVWQQRFDAKFNYIAKSELLTTVSPRDTTTPTLTLTPSFPVLQTIHYIFFKITRTITTVKNYLINYINLAQRND